MPVNLDIRTHAQVRGERYGMDLEWDDIRVIGQLIRDGQSVLTAKLDTGAERHMVQYQGQILLAVYDPLSERIHTFLRTGVRQKNRTRRRV